MTAMLTAPNEDNRPLFAARDITDFYLEHCPSIFPHDEYVNLLHKNSYNMFFRCVFSWMISQFLVVEHVAIHLVMLQR